MAFWYKYEQYWFLPRPKVLYKNTFKQCSLWDFSSPLVSLLPEPIITMFKSLLPYTPHTLISKTARKCVLNLIPNMHLIMKDKKLTTPPKPRRFFGSTCTWQCTRLVKACIKEPESSPCWLDVHRGISKEWAVMLWQTLVLVLMRTANVDEESNRRDRRYCIVEIR